MRDEAAKLRGEFPHADPELFEPDLLAEFGSGETLRFAVEASHRRVAGILDAERQRIREELNAEYAARLGGGNAGPGGTPPVTGADPSIEQLAAMSASELAELEAEKPGLVEKLLRGAA